MNSQLSVLLGSEWRQRRTQFFICMLWMACTTAYSIAYYIAYQPSGYLRIPVLMLSDAVMFFGLVMPIFLAMRTSLGETTDHTRAFSDGLPISARRRGWIRLAGGAGALIVPIVASAVLLSICLAFGWFEQIPKRPPSGAFSGNILSRESLSAHSAVGMVWCVAAVAIWSATLLYLVLSLLGTKLRAESHLGYAGVALTMVWFLGYRSRDLLESLGLPLIADWAGAIAPQSILMNFSYGHERGGYEDLSIFSTVAGPLLINSLIQFALAVWFIRRYSRGWTGRAAEPAKKIATRLWHPWTLKLPTRGIALAWLTLRQAVPMSLPGLVIACLMAFSNLDITAPYSQDVVLQRYTASLPLSIAFVGQLWGAVVGAGIFSTEIDWRIGEFWRTRPISAGRLFGIKFFVGLLAVLLVLDGTAIAVNWRSPYWGGYYSMSWPYIACFLPLHATMFAIAAAWTCVLRRAVLGGMAAIASIALLYFTLEWSSATRKFNIFRFTDEFIRATTKGANGPLDFTAHGYPIFAMEIGLTLLAAIVIGWLALRRYDPRRQT